MLFFVIMVIAIVVMAFYIPKKFSALLLVTIILGILSLKLLLTSFKVKYFDGVQLKSNSIVIPGLVFKTEILLESINPNSIESFIINDSSYETKYKISGINIPDFLYGWFMLKNNMKGFVVISDYNQNVVKFETDEHCMLLSLRQHELFISELKNKLKHHTD